MKTLILQPIYFMIALMLFTTINIQAENNPPPVTLHVATAGTLPTMISASEKNQITDLKLTGKLNGTDIRYIREMAGRDYYGTSTNGSLVTLDIAGCDIVSGGERYYYQSTSLTYSTTNNTIGAYMFSICELISITLPNSVTSISNSAFYGCTSLTSITIGNNVMSIGNYAFYGCSGLTSISLPDNIQTIDSYAFHGCTSLKEFILAESNNYYRTLDGILFNKHRTTLIYYPAAKEGNTYSIPKSVRSIEHYAFYGCSGLTSIVISDNVKTIGSRVFYNCTGLTSITMGNGVTSIGESAFNSCSGLRSIVIPDNVRTIGSRVFYNCIGLTSITMGNEVTSIGESAFDGCTGLTSIIIPDNVRKIESKTFKGCTNLTSIDMSNGLTSIGEEAFSGCVSLTDITLPNSLTAIQYEAFYNCASLKSMNISNNVKKIESKTFKGCTNLTSIDMSNGLTSIGEEAFSGCKNLTSITVFDKVTEIGEYAFYDCTSLKEFIVAQDNPNYRAINGVLFNKNKTTLICYPNAKGSIYNVPEGVIQIGLAAFMNCIDVESISLSNSITSIEQFAFSNCTALTSITIPNSVKSIGSDAFSDCTKLNSVKIGKSVSTIGNNAFSGCSLLSSIYCYPTKPPAVRTDGLKDVNKSTCKLYVPQNSYGAYWATAPWYDFDNIIGFDPEVGVKITTLKGIKLYPNPVVSSLYIDLDTNKEIHHISIYNTSGQIIQKEVIANSYIQLDVSSYPAGTYIVQASGTNNQLYNLGKFAKE